MSTVKKCIFCNHENLAILFQDAKYLLFKDIHPATEHHYLVIPREHYPNVKYLDSSHLPMIEEMKSVALSYGQTNIAGFDTQKLRLGFHWPPFNSIGHLHLHLLYPVEQMSLISRLVFQPNWFWFSEVEKTVEYLRQKTSTTAPTTTTAEKEGGGKEESSN